MASRRRGKGAARTSKTSSRSAEQGPASARSPGKGRRRPTTGRGSSGKARHSHSGELRPDRDGRYRLSCPNCGTNYAIAEDHLDSRLTCKSCKSGFTPRTVLERPSRVKKKNPIKGPLIFGGVVIGFFVLLFIINSGGKKPEKPLQPRAKPRMVNIDLSHPAWLAYEEFHQAIADKNAVTLATRFDFASNWEREKPQGATSWSFLPQKEQEAYRLKVQKRLFETKEGDYFREMNPGEPTPVALKREATQASFVATGSPRDEKWNGMSEIQVEVVKKDGIWKVAGFKVLHIPKKPRAKVLRGKNRHPKISRPKVKAVKIGNKTYKVAVSKATSLPHLASTPQALRKEIDDLLEVLIDPSAPFKKMSHARTRLTEIGKPAVPRILTKMYENKGATQADRESLRLLIDVFNDITGAALVYTPGRPDDPNFGSPEVLRKTAIGKAFAFWYMNFKKKTFKVMDEEEKLPPPPKRRGLKPRRTGGSGK